MKRLKRVVMILLLASLIILPAAPSSALQINPNIHLNDSILSDLFISAHRVIKAEPVYRVLVDDALHWYTTNEDEFNYWVSHKGINNDGIASYISPVPLPYTVPMWNMVKNDVEQYFATSEASRDSAVGNTDTMTAVLWDILCHSMIRLTAMPKCFNGTGAIGMIS